MADDINIQQSWDAEADAKTRTSPVFPSFLNCPSLAFLLFLHPAHGFLDRLEVIARFLCAFVRLLLEEFKLGLEGFEVVDGWNGIRRVPDEGGGQRRR